MARDPRIRFMLAALAVFFLVGCGDDDPVEPPADTGTIVIDQTPDALAGAGWTLTGPQNESGSGDATLTEMPVGQYTVTWNAVSGYITPTSAPQTLAADGTITFSGTYVIDLGPTGGFVLIPAGTFQMGSPTDEPGRYSNETLHTVTLNQGFYIARTEVTEKWWDEVMGSGSSTSQLPKAYVSWDAAVAFCNQLSLDEGLTPAYTINGPDGDVIWNRAANGYRLPTEAEWEYACRATTTLAFNNGTNCLSSTTEANYNGRYSLTGCPTGVYRWGRTEVGTFPANQWGLYDMHGNLWEWVWDGYRSDYENLPSEDPAYDVGPGADRVIRGGDWNADAQDCRSARRDFNNPDFSLHYIGFRPVRSTD